MMTAQEMVASYLQWLKQSISVREAGEWVELTTPFLDRHNDHLQIYVRSDGDQLLLTDDGYTLNDLAASGCDVTTERRRELMDTILAGFGVQADGSQLMARATRTTFGPRKHALLQAMVAVNDLFLTSRDQVRGLFIEDVQEFLQTHHIRFVPGVQIPGRSGLSHHFDYVIPAWGQAPERIVEGINHATREKVTSLLFKWQDIRAIRKQQMAMFALVNDAERQMPRSLQEACSDYGVRVIPWSQRQSVIDELIA